jgi:hypothetical protein
MVWDRVYLAQKPQPKPNPVALRFDIELVKVRGLHNVTI